MAQNSMAKRDGMTKDTMAMAKPVKHEGMKKGSMKHDAMMGGSMKHDAMNPDSMSAPSH